MEVQSPFPRLRGLGICEEVIGILLQPLQLLIQGLLGIRHLMCPRQSLFTSYPWLNELATKLYGLSCPI